jgi:excisionase family DNA binding protein
VGVGSEKLLTLEEAARRLGVPADDVEVLVRSGGLASFRLGGSLLRVRLCDVESLRGKKLGVGSWELGVGTERAVLTPDSELQAPSSRWERIVDFCYFNDFYLAAILIILTLLAIIFSL